MITKKDIEKLGWKQIAVCANGGSLMFSQDNHLLHFHGDNSFYKRDNDPRLKEIEIEILYSDLSTVTIYKGHPIDVDDLKSITQALAG